MKKRILFLASLLLLPSCGRSFIDPYYNNRYYDYSDIEITEKESKFNKDGSYSYTIEIKNVGDNYADLNSFIDHDGQSFRVAEDKNNVFANRILIPGESCEFNFNDRNSINFNNNPFYIDAYYNIDPEIIFSESYSIENYNDEGGYRIFFDDSSCEEESEYFVILNVLYDGKEYNVSSTYNETYGAVIFGIDENFDISKFKVKSAIGFLTEVDDQPSTYINGLYALLIIMGGLGILLFIVLPVCIVLFKKRKTKES